CEPLCRGWLACVFELRLPASVPRSLENLQPARECDRHGCPRALDALSNLFAGFAPDHAGKMALILPIQVDGTGELGNTVKGSPVVDEAVAFIAAYQLLPRRAG